MWKKVYGSGCAMHALRDGVAGGDESQMTALVVFFAKLFEDLARFEQAHVGRAAIQVVRRPC